MSCSPSTNPLTHPSGNKDHLFLSMKTDLAGVDSATREACENQLPLFGANRDMGTRIFMREALFIINITFKWKILPGELVNI